MALITDKPEDLPSTNELDKLPSEATTPAELRLGQAVLMTMLQPPAAGSYIDISARLYIKHEGFDQNTPDSPQIPVRQAKLIAAWPLGTDMPKSKEELDGEAKAEAEKNQPPLFAVPDSSHDLDSHPDGDGPEFSDGES